MQCTQSSHADIVLVEGDETLREAITRVFTQRGLKVHGYRSTTEFAHELGGYRAACILLDAHHADEDGIAFLGRVGVGNLPGPVIMMSRETSVTQIVRAIRLGAIDFIEKPFDVDHLPLRVCAVLSSAANASDERRTAVQAEQLTARQRQILPLVLRGFSNKAIARQIGISPRTVEVHRAHIKRRLGLAHLADLVR